MADIEPTEAMVQAGIVRCEGEEYIPFTAVIRAALNHPDVRARFGAPAAGEMVDRVALAIEKTMWAEHELPLDPETHAKYRITAQAAIAAIVQDPTPAVPTVSVRADVVVERDGIWWIRCLEEQPVAGGFGCRAYTLTATLPLPQPVDVAATVEADRG